VNEVNWTYLGQLTRALAYECVEGRRAGEFVAEIESHLAETGADPVEEFGTPYDLAVELAKRPGAHRPGWVPPLWLLWLLQMAATLIYMTALGAIFLRGRDGRIAVYWFYALVAGIVMPVGALYGYVATRRLRGRSWGALKPGRFLLAALVIAIAFTVATLLVADRIIVTVPAGLFWVAAVIALPLLIALYFWRHDPIRFPDHAKHLNRLKWAPLRRRPPVPR